MRSIAIKELTLLEEHDCLLLQNKTHGSLSIAPHFHSEYEIILIRNASGAVKTIGAHESVLGEQELLLIGPGLPHSWKPGHCTSSLIRETTIHFHPNWLGNGLLHRQEMHSLKNLLEQAEKGLRFPQETIGKVLPLLDQMENNKGFNLVLNQLQLLNLLSKAEPDCLCERSEVGIGDQRLELVIQYMSRHFKEALSLKQAARMAGLSEIYFCRSFKQYSGRTFIEFLNELRVQHVSRMLTETTHSITEIALEAGFKNLSNFNRIFRSRQHLSPRQYREIYSVEGQLRLCS
ncbi:MAG TPA: helix-turn-helix domain-containing protein [Flavisolibacter sp.]|jgi:AraC-like DNA-binding protein|nr:helix-turn-helix domain-containing protein [Flavisolibacter sp.]